MGKTLSEEETIKLAQHLSFESMKKNPAVNYVKDTDRKKESSGVVENEPFMRAGIVGDYKTKMPSHIIEEFDEWIEKNVQGTGWEL